jgi:hypothetical protein
MANRVEKVASEVMGAIKAAKATFEGLPGVFKELAREHGEVMALLARLRMTSDAAVRRELFPQIREELLSHEKGELAVVYPALREHEELAAYAEMHEREAETIERMIDGLSGMAYEDHGWRDAFDELVNTVKRHTKEEEDEFFPAAARVMGRERAIELTDPFLEKKRSIMQSGAASDGMRSN